MQDRRLTLCVPSLFVTQAIQTPAILPDLNSSGLDRLMSRARRKEGGTVGFIPLLFHLFDLFNGGAQDLPVAAITRLSSGKTAPQDFYLRADPVQLKADRDCVVMLGNRHLAIQKTEAEQLAKEFNAFFAEEKLHLEVLSAERWCLRVEQAPQISTTALADVIGQNIDPHLPSGADALHWHRLLNEIQMLFHNSAVNQTRQAQGRASINSVWFWGGGVLPKPNGQSVWQSVCSNEDIAPALALHSGVKHGAVAANGQEYLQQMTAGQHLLVLHGGRHAMQHGDIGAWRDFVKALNDDWIVPLLDALKTADLAELELHTADGTTFLLTTRELRRWWKRDRSFINFGSL